MADLPMAHIMDYPYPPEFPTAKVAYLVEGLRLKDGADRGELLSELSFTVNRYKLDSIADKTRCAGILEALRNPDGAYTHTWAAHQLIERQERARKKLRNEYLNGPELELVAQAAAAHQARIEYRGINTKPKRWAKHVLAVSLARILERYTTEKINTSRLTGRNMNDGVLADLFQSVLELVDGCSLKDPFPYLKFASKKR